jgi:hypothetical protein
MADLEKGPPLSPEKSDEDEPIIDLVEEIDAQPDDLLDLENNLLALESDIGRSLGEVPENGLARADELPELAGISWTGEETSEAAAQSPERPMDDIDWLLEGLNQSVSPGTDKIEDVHESELVQAPVEEEQFLEAEEIPDDEPALFEDSAETSADLDLPDADDVDNELIWFDEPTRGGLVEAAPRDSDAPPAPSDLDLIMGAQTAAAKAPSKAPAPETLADDFLPASLAATALAGLPGETTPPAPPDTSARLDPSPEQIEAAVARLIEEKYAPRIEAAIYQAIEKAVQREIERLKRLLRDADL